MTVIQNHFLIYAKLHAESPPPSLKRKLFFSSRNWFGYN